MTRRLAVVTLAAAVLLTACATNPQDETADKLRDGIGETVSEPRRFDYAYQAAGPAIRVQGVVEDDGRYSVTLLLDGERALEEIASDDLLADRFLLPGAVDFLLRRPDADRAAPQGTGPAAAPTAPSVGVPGDPRTVKALREGRWVLDEVGAPNLVAATSEMLQSQGKDPVVDALTALSYVEAVVQQQPFREFNEDALDYDPEEDSFPRPTKGIVRYDSIRPPLPTAAQMNGVGGRAVLPDAASFRKMSIYLDEAGRVAQVYEVIDVADRVRELLKRAKLPAPKGLSEAQLAEGAIKAVNDLRVSAGDAPIIVHTLSIKLSDIGADLRVTVPKTGAVNGDLSLLANRGRMSTTPGAAPTPAT